MFLPTYVPEIQLEYQVALLDFLKQCVLFLRAYSFLYPGFLD